MSDAVRAQLAEQLGALTRETIDMRGRLAATQERLRRSEQRWRQGAERAARDKSAEAEHELHRQQKAIEANVAEARDAASRIVETGLATSAPRYLAADWDDAIWSDLPDSSAGPWLRVGSCTVDEFSVPVVLPLSAGTWSVGSDSNEDLRAFVQNATARLAAAFDPSRIRLVIYDPELRLDLAIFARLRSVAQATVPPAITSPDEFVAALQALRNDVASVDDGLTAAGLNSFWTALADAHPLARTTPLRVLLVACDRNQLPDGTAALLDQLRTLAADRGLLIIETGKEPPHSASAAQITLKGDHGSVNYFPSLAWRPDAWVGERFVRRLCTQLLERPRPDSQPTVAFDTIVQAIDNPWMIDADDGLEAVVGVFDGGAQVLRLRSENPPMPNALVGGAVGQGKSNLLLVLIHSLAAAYSPAELEMVLIDLRDGVEFSRLGPTGMSPTWLPHVRALGLEFDPDYCLSVLCWIRLQMTERAAILKRCGATSLKEYRQATGRTMPRLLVVIDEFQRLFEGDDDQARDSAQELDAIARTGRGFGIHLILASQALTGIHGLATKTDSILGQFHNRIVLKNTAAESQAFLSAHNLAASTLEYRGQAVFNESLGAPEGNRLGTVAHAEPSFLRQLQVGLFQQGHGVAPSIFRAGSFADWPGQQSTVANPDGLSVPIGLPVAIEAQVCELRMTRSPNQALCVVGSTQEVARAVLARAAVSAAASLGPGARVVLLDGESPGEAATEWIAALSRALAESGCDVERIDRSGVAHRLVELRGQLQEGLILPVALDSVDLNTPVEPDFTLPSEALRDILKTGPLSGMWTIGWWQSKAVLEEHLGFRAPGVRAWAFAGAPRDDLTDIAGHLVREPKLSPRIVYFDRTSARAAERLIPFAPEGVFEAAGV